MATDTTGTAAATRTAGLTGLHYLGIALAVVTGVIHLFLGVSFFPEPMGILFLLAGLGFLGGVVLFLLDYRRTLLYLVGAAFTAVQIVAYVPVNLDDLFSPIGVVDKVVQLVLVVVLVVLYRRESA